MICIFFFLSFLSVGRRHLFNINGYSRRAVLFLLIKKKKKKKLTRSLSQPHQHQKQQNFIHLETEKKNNDNTHPFYHHSAVGTVLLCVKFVAYRYTKRATSFSGIPSHILIHQVFNCSYHSNSRFLHAITCTHACSHSPTHHFSHNILIHKKKYQKEERKKTFAFCITQGITNNECVSGNTSSHPCMSVMVLGLPGPFQKEPEQRTRTEMICF